VSATVAGGMVAASPPSLAAVTGLSESGHASRLSVVSLAASPPPPTDDIGDAAAAAAASIITPLVSPVAAGTCWIGARRIGGGMTIGSTLSNW